jgi:RNA polymerase sigma factor (TIGR02999 family)
MTSGTQSPRDASAKLTTELLTRFRGGSASAQAELAPLILRELRRVAAGHLRRERPNHTLQATALVNEVWIRLAQQPDLELLNRAHFFALSSRLMRQILVDYARRRNASKRGGLRKQITLQDCVATSDGTLADVLALDEALNRLKCLDPRASQVVEMHFFSGLPVEEMALVLGVSSRTVARDWRMARAWLRRQLSPRV